MELPPLLVNTTALLKLPELVGAKRTTRLVEPNPARLNPDASGERILKGPPVIVATPLVTAAAPRLLTTKLA